MKLKISLAVAALVCSVNYVQAGDPGPRWRAEARRQQQAERTWTPTTTVAVYARGGIGRREIVAQEPATTEHLEFRMHGRETTPLYVQERE